MDLHDVSFEGWSFLEAILAKRAYEMSRGIAMYGGDMCVQARLARATKVTIRTRVWSRSLALLLPLTGALLRLLLHMLLLLLLLVLFQKSHHLLLLSKLRLLVDRLLRVCQQKQAMKTFVYVARID